jgi:hypothetical protein
MGKIQLNLTLVFNIPERGINVNGILYGLKKSTPEIMSNIFKTLLMAIEEKTIQDIQAQAPNRYRRNGHQHSRTLRTSFGQTNYAFAVIQDLTNGKNRVPLRERLQVPKYQQYQNESMESAIGLAIHLSYQRSGFETDRIRGAAASKWTIRRKLFDFSNSQCLFGDMTKIPYRFLMADGTKVRLQGMKGVDLGNHSLSWALASTGEKQPFDFVGIWVDTPWATICQDLQKRLCYKGLEVLISDGESELIRALRKPGMRLQRCVVHARRDFPFFLFIDHLKKKKQAPFVDLLKSVPALQFSSESMEKLQPKDRPKVRAAIQKTKESFSEIINMLSPEKYPTSRTYITNLSESICTFLDWWLKKGEWIPHTTNVIENRFSQVKNRIKRIGRRWSDAGLLLWCLATIQKVYYPNQWDQLWKQYLKINRSITLTHLSVSFQWV